MFNNDLSLNTTVTSVPKNIKIVNPYELKSYFAEQLEQQPLGIVNPEKFLYFYDIISNQPMAVPIEYVFWGQERKKPVSSTTNGGGAHTNKELAVLSGMHEYIERDAFLTHWLLKKTPSKVALESIKKTTSIEIISRLKAMGFVLNILVLDSEVGVPTFTSCIFDTRAEPFTFVTAGATDAFDYENAIYRALTESLSVLQESLEDLKKPISKKIYLPFLDSTIGRKERILFWKGAWVLEELKWFVSGQEILLEDIKNQFPELQKGPKNNQKLLALHLKKNMPELDIYVYNLESLITGALGVHVIKVFIPQLLQLYLFEHLANVNTERLEKLSKKKGKSLLLSLNPNPHPYP